mgnify:CR=1 FL=1
MNEPTPFEITLTLRTHTQMHDICTKRFDRFDSFAPSTNLEGELGFDFQIRNLKGVVFQFKRPKPSKSGTHRFQVRYSNESQPRQLQRVKNYARKFGEGTAYYALPLVKEHSGLDQALAKTAFVKATGIPEDASIVHIPPDYCEGGRRKSNSAIDVYCSDPDNTSNNRDRRVSSNEIYGWWDLYERLIDCQAGFRIRWALDNDDGESVSYQQEYHDDRQYLGQKRENEYLTVEDVLGLRTQSGPVIARFGSDTDSAFSTDLTNEELSVLSESTS